MFFELDPVYGKPSDSARGHLQELRVSKVQSPAFAQEPPVIEIKDRVAIIRYRGKEHCERAMSIRTLGRTVERAQLALRRHASGDEHIVIDE
jgi:hypothetical protein